MVIEGTKGVLENPGAPVDGTDEIQTVTISGGPAGGTFRLSFQGFVTDEIAYNAAAAAVQAALEALPSIGAGGVGVSGSAGGPYTVTFGGNLAKLAVPLIALDTNSLTGGTTPSVGIVEATPGVTATARGAAPAALLVDTATPTLYINTGTALEPTWTVAGTQA